MAGPSSARLQGEAAAFTAALRTLVNNPQFSDVTFVVGPEQQKVFAHRCVLVCRCQAFQGMLCQGPVDSEDSPSGVPPQGPFILGNVQPEVFLTVIEFLYTNSVTLNRHIALEVLTSSVEYGLQDLCKLCIKFIKDTLSIEQVCEALQAAVTYGQADLQQHCLSFIEDCTAAVVRTQGFHELSDTVLARVLRSDHLDVDELDLVQAVREWAHVSSAVLERPVSEVAALPVQELRLPLLAPSELATLETHNQQDLLIPMESIAAAWRSHALRKGSGVPSRLCRPRRGTRPPPLLPREPSPLLSLFPGAVLPSAGSEAALQQAASADSCLSTDTSPPPAHGSGGDGAEQDGEAWVLEEKTWEERCQHLRTYSAPPLPRQRPLPHPEPHPKRLPRQHFPVPHGPRDTDTHHRGCQPLCTPFFHTHCM